MKLAQPALNILFEQFQDRFVNNRKKNSFLYIIYRSNESIRSELARCIGFIGYVMLNEREPK
jgi:hypothetical protein